MKPGWATFVLVVLLSGFMLLAMRLPGQNEIFAAFDCTAVRPTYEILRGADPATDAFVQITEQSAADVCALAASGTIDCGTFTWRLGTGLSNPEASQCAVTAHRGGRPFVYRESWSGVDDLHESWVVGAPDGQLYFIDTGYYLSLGQDVEAITFLCTSATAEKLYGADVEVLRCEEGTKLKEYRFSPYAPSR